MTASSSESLSADEQRAGALLHWFAHHQRRLPWRSEPGAPRSSPYAVLVSELMLQQTRVETVLDYFVRWMARWPEIADLAAAPLDDVLAQWTGLGYYNRARNLHKTAQVVVAEHGGSLPTDAVQLAALPGLGPYTVGAVGSIAFGQATALVDGNVARVLARWHALDGDPSQGAARRAVWNLAETWLSNGPPRHDPGAWNQALMELGATVCVPRNPRCDACPVATDCHARQQGRQAEIPPVRVRKAPSLVAATYALVLRDPELLKDAHEWAAGVTAAGERLVLLARRPDGGRWAGLWEPPGCEGPDATPRMRNWLAAQGLREIGVLAPVVHVLTHRRYEAVGLCAQQADFDARPGANLPNAGLLGYTDVRWLPLGAALAQTSGLSRLAQRLVEQLANDGP